MEKNTLKINKYSFYKKYKKPLLKNKMLKIVIGVTQKRIRKPEN